MRYLSFLFAPFLFAVSVLVLAGCASTVQIDFSNLSTVATATTPALPVNIGDRFQVGDVLVENQSGVRLIVLPFRWPTATHDPACPAGVNGWTPGGHVEIVADNMAGGTGAEVHFNNATLGILAPGSETVSDLKFKFGDHGGNINLIVNGTLFNDDNFATITPPAGVTMTVTPGLPLGTVQASGSISPFTFTFPCPVGFPVQSYTAVIGGGQELWVDDLEFTQ